MIELSNIHTKIKDGWYKVIIDLKSQSFGNDTIWFSVPMEFKDYLSIDRYDAFLITILYPAMYYGEDIKIDGSVSYKLYSNIMTYIQAILLAYSPELKKINIEVSDFLDEQRAGIHAIGTGFSGGVDSFCTVYDHLILEQNIKQRVNVFVFLNTGSHGRFSNVNTYNIFISRYNYLKDYPKSMEMPFVPVDSNVHYYHEKWGHQKTHTLTTIAGILALQNKFSQYYVASAISYSEMMIYGKDSKNLDIAEYSEAYLLPLLSTENLKFISDGQQYTRTEKTIHIKNYKPAMEYLNVCVNPKISNEKNCSICSKCCRTLMTLESTGLLEDFSKVFDITKYKHKSFIYKCEQRLLYNKNPFAKDNIDLARKNKKKIPCLGLALIICFPQTVKHFLKRIIKIYKQNKYSV
jgi:hypothetical protein